MADKLPDPPDYNLAAAIAGDVLLCLFIVCLFICYSVCCHYNITEQET